MAGAFKSAFKREGGRLFGINESELAGSVFEQEEILQRIKNESGKVPYGILTGDFRYKLGMWVLQPCMNVVLGKDGSFVNVTETEEFRNYFARLVDWKKKGLLEVVYDDSRQKSDGIYFVQDGEAANCLIQNDQVFETVLQVFERNGTQQDAKVVAVPNEEAPLLDPYQGEHPICIASWTEKREMAEDFLVRLMTDSEIANLIQYGIKDQDYILDGTAVQVIQGARLDYTDGNDYTNPLITGSTAAMAKDKLAYADRFHEAYESEFPDGFRFDPLPVLEQIAETNRVYDDVLYEDTSEAVSQMMFLQTEDVDQTIADVTAQLKAAGIDEVINEANRQLEEWRSREMGRQ